MAKTRTRKKAEEAPAERSVPTPPEPLEVIDPIRVHELFRAGVPYDPPKPPQPLPGYHAYWDCGLSMQSLRQRFRDLFYEDSWVKHPFAKATDRWRWRQIRAQPVEPGKPYAEQLRKLPKGDEVARARDVAAYLALVFLATGRKVDGVRLRCQDVLESGRRVLIGPFHEHGIGVASAADDWASPGVGLASIFTPRRK